MYFVDRICCCGTSPPIVAYRETIHGYLNPLIFIRGKDTKTSNDIANEKDQSRYSELRLKLILGLGQSLNIEPFVQHNPV